MLPGKKVRETFFVSGKSGIFDWLIEGDFPTSLYISSNACSNSTNQANIGRGALFKSLGMFLYRTQFLNRMVVSYGWLGFSGSGILYPISQFT